MEEYIQRLLLYLPIDFGDEENNEYREYLVNACLENYNNGKFQFSLMAFHMLFMAFLYKEFWILKTYSHDQVEKLCKANSQFEAVENVFDASIIPEQKFIYNYLGVFAWHANKRSEVEEFVDKRDRCAHNSGFIQYDQDKVEQYFRDVIKSIEKIAAANKENIVSTFKGTIMRYLNGSTFQTTLIGDFVRRELSDKKYSYQDIANFLFLDVPNIILNKKIAYYFAMVYLQEYLKQAGYEEYVNPEVDYKAKLIDTICALSTEKQEEVRIQVEDETAFLEGLGFDVGEILEALPSVDEEAMGIA